MMWVLALPGSAAQEVLNGNFENTQIDSCGINLFNEVFTLRMANAFAFGEENELDVMSEACGFGPAAEGFYFVALNSDGGSDAFSLELSEPLVAGRRYYFSFRQRAGDSTIISRGVNIGLSNQRDSFGESLYTSSEELPERWQEFLIEVIPNQAGRYLTVRAPRGRSWVFVDDFRPACPPPIDLGPDTTVCNANSLNLGLELDYDTYEWQDGSTSPAYAVREPGIYSLTVTYQGCSLSDEIRIDEFPANCLCRVYVPNVFSPNNDGINDEIRPESGCVFTYFEIAIYDRWGNQVYYSQDPMADWDGQVNRQPAGKAVYGYVLKYQFDYQDEPAFQTGTILLLSE